MCGIVGFINKYGMNGFDADIVKVLLYVNALRGEDSTGVFSIPKKDKKVNYIKVLGGPSHLFDEEAYNNFKDSFDQYHGVVGHGRFATVGDIVVKYAHPFVHDKIVLVHNGRITNYEDIKKQFKLKTESDSEAVSYLFNNVPFEEALDRVRGAYTFVVYNKEQRRIYFARNNERPLWFYRNELQTKLLFSSEWPVFDFIEHRYNQAYSKGEKFPLPDTGYYYFDLNKEPKEGLPLYEVKGHFVSQKRDFFPVQSSNISTIKKNDKVGLDKIEELAPLHKLLNTNVDFFITEVEFKKNIKNKVDNYNIYLLKGMLADSPYTDAYAILSSPLAPEKILQLENATIVATVFKLKVVDGDVKVILEIPANSLKELNKVIEEQEFVKFTNDKLRTKKDALDLISKGCAECTKPLKLSSIDFLYLVEAKDEKTNKELEYVLCLDCQLKYQKKLDTNAPTVH